MRPKLAVAHSFAALVGLACGVVIAHQFAPSARAAGTAWVYPGNVNAGKCDSWAPPQNWNPHGLTVNQNHYCWHFDEASPYQWNGATDQHTGSGSADANQPVYWIHGASTWNEHLNVRFDKIPGTGCTGVRVVLTSGLAGSFSYLHVDDIPANVDGSTWQDWYTWPGWVQGQRYLGETAASQQNCPWDGPHLHQGGNVDWWTDIWRQNPALTSCGSGLYCWSGAQFSVSW